MKKFLAILLVGMVGHVNAGFYGSTGDTFDWGGFTWTVTVDPGNNNDGFVVDGEDATFGEVQIVGSDTGDAGNAITSMMTTSASDGIISLTWDYFTYDEDSVYDPFVWLNGGSETQLTTDGLTGNQVATQQFDVTAGTIFGFAITTDNLLGGGGYSADVALSEFSFTADTGGNPGTPSAVPIPPAFLLFGTAMIGFGFMRNKKEAV